MGSPLQTSESESRDPQNQGLGFRVLRSFKEISAAVAATTSLTNKGALTISDTILG